MNISICILTALILAYFFSDIIKKYSLQLYIITGTISIIAIVHTIFILNGYRVEYISGLGKFMDLIDSGAMGGALFIIVMYMGVLDMKQKVSKKLRMNRAEISILACIVTIPHNIHYFFEFLINSHNLGEMKGLSLWSNLMMFASGVFAVAIMIPLFVTSFQYFRKKMKGKEWKTLQEFAYIFYAMIYIQVMNVFIVRPNSFDRNFNLVIYSVIFLSYTVFRIVKLFRMKRMRAA